MIGQAKQAAGEVAGQVKEQASNRLAEQIGQTSEGLHSASEAIRSVGRELRSEQVPNAQYADRAADQVDRISSYLRDKDLDQIVGDVERFARQNPATFIGGAFALGLLAARFLKSTPDQRLSMMDRSYSGGYGGQSRSTPSWTQQPTSPTWNEQMTPTANRPSEPVRQESTHHLPATTSPGSGAMSGSSTPGSSLSQPSPSSTPTPGTSPTNSPTSPQTRPGGLTGGEDSGFRQSA
jgi:hypothetical protein